jgi:TFIIH basal transcription factor complex TTD-A subunit
MLAQTQEINTHISSPGLLIECDPSIKAMILKYDEERHDYIVEDLDDENHLVIKESQLENLKARLDHVCSPLRPPMPISLSPQAQVCPVTSALTRSQDLDEKIMQLDESESE